MFATSPESFWTASGNCALSTAHVETGPPGSFAEALDAVKQRAQSDN